MTIKELETRCGLDRATIRFYEKEGLLAPVRKANGYRDYSEEDALTLEKIAFLRQLGLSLEIIRAVQSGELPLGIALEKQDEQLLARQMEAQQALRISRAIRAEGASYQTLQPEKYKSQLPADIYSEMIAHGEKQESAAGYFWRRVLARCLDLTCYQLPYALWMLLLAGVGWWTMYDMFRLTGSLWIGLSVVILEPLLLVKWGTTPGKRVMGLRLQYRYTRGSGTPTYLEAMGRAAQMFLRGCGLGLPVVHLFCQVQFWLRCRRKEEQPWDETWEYTVTDPLLHLRYATYLVSAGLLYLMITKMTAALLP